MSELKNYAEQYVYSTPQGFVLPTEVINYFFEKANLRSSISQKLANLDQEDYHSLQSVSNAIQNPILNALFQKRLGEGVKEVLEESQAAVANYQLDEDSAINFLVGQVMRRSGGKADAKEARELLQQLLEEKAG